MEKFWNEIKLIDVVCAVLGFIKYRKNNPGFRGALLDERTGIVEIIK